MPTSSGTKSEHLEDITARRSRLFGKYQNNRFNDQSRNRIEIIIAIIAIAIIGLTFAWSQLMPEKANSDLAKPL